METAITTETRHVPTFEEFMASMEELRKSHAETERIVKENVLSIKETERIVRNNARQMDRTDQQIKETSQVVKDLGKQMGGLHNSFGELAEHLVAPGIVERFNEMGYAFDDVSLSGRKILDENGKVKAEIDILLENGEFIIAVEVKSKAVKNDVEHHIKRLQILREHRDKHHDKRKVRGAIAGAVFLPGAKEAVLEAGFYVIEQSGDTMHVDIPEGFVPNEW